MTPRPLTAAVYGFIAAVAIGGFLVAPSSARSGAPEQGSQAVVIVLENREFGEVVGSEQAPYFNALIERGALATRSYGLLHPSLPNYLALIGGSTFGIAENCTDCLASGPNLATQLSAADISWRAYMGGMPQPCFTGADAGGYVKRHNPFMYFNSITSQPRLCRRVVPESVLDEDLAAHELPRLAWLSPNLCDNGHDCPITASDAYLRHHVPGILRQLGPGGLLVITYDEGTSAAGCCRDAIGGHIATLLLGPGVRAGIRLTQPYTPYSLLATLEDRFGLLRLRHAKSAVTMAPAFRAHRHRMD